MDKFENTPEIQTDFEPISPEKKYQNRIWQEPTDEEVTRISNSLRKITGADTSYKSLENIHQYEYTKLMEKSSSKRLIELGSAHRTMKDIKKQISLENAGIREYIAVDYDLDDRYTNLEITPSTEDYEKYIKSRQGFINPSYKLEPPEPDQRIKSKGLRMEILQALHSFPDNYGNVWMTGLDSMVFDLRENWQFAVIAEIKRVVPENCFIFTDGGFIDEVLEKCVPAFRKAKKIFDSLYSKDAGKQLSKYACKPDDPYSWGKESINPEDPMFSPRTNLGKYVIDAPEIGFRIYFDKIGLAHPIIIINTSKTPT